MVEIESDLHSEIDRLEELKRLIETDLEFQDKLFAATVDLVKRIVRSPLTNSQKRRLINEISMSHISNVGN